MEKFSVLISWKICEKLYFTSKAKANKEKLK